MSILLCTDQNLRLKTHQNQNAVLGKENRYKEIKEHVDERVKAIRKTIAATNKATSSLEKIKDPIMATKAPVGKIEERNQKIRERAAKANKAVLSDKEKEARNKVLRQHVIERKAANIIQRAFRRYLLN